KLEAGSWKLEAGSWKLEAGRQHEPRQHGVKGFSSRFKLWTKSGRVFFQLPGAKRRSSSF
ncbi:hypothetical protein, partial [Halomonas elongata]|uniref:hypothetical protein n=1 Tax=Halomonas elongata TaxID=2746 RepID=UPI0023AF4371